jgi:glucose/arabinose dehydrogenase
LSVFNYNPVTKQASGKKKLLDLPGGSLGVHFTRSLLFMPAPNEDTLLIAIGSSCNVCNESEQMRAKIWFYDIKTGQSGEYAKGLRNSVFMAIHPVTGAVWVTEMGRDGLGDNTPPDEINIITKNANYGWPVCYGQNIHDTDFDKNTYIRNPCMASLETPSHIDLQAHSAPLGLAFIPEEGWPEDYWFNALVAYHGSWNRSEPTGYKIVRIKLDDKGNYVSIEDFITGWLKADGTKVGRPVDIKVLPGGIAYISDDSAGVIYRLQRL